MFYADCFKHLVYCHFAPDADLLIAQILLYAFLMSCDRLKKKKIWDLFFNILLTVQYDCAKVSPLPLHCRGTTQTGQVNRTSEPFCYVISV